MGQKHSDGLLRNKDFFAGLTLFTIPKPFRGHSAIIQRNAINSWTLLRPRPDIIILGNEEGTTAVSKELGVQQVPDVVCNEYGTPLLNDIFEKAEQFANTGLLCYVNADIILMGDFMKALTMVKLSMGRFLMIGRRWDVNFDEVLDFGPDWEAKFRVKVITGGRPGNPAGMDYFVFPKETLGGIPPFAIGRTAWDSWLIYRARALKAPVINASDAILAVHQNHDYAHISIKAGDVWKGPEAKRNLELTGGRKHCFDLLDSTHKLTSAGLKLELGSKHLKRRLDTVPILYPRFKKLIRPVMEIVRIPGNIKSIFKKLLGQGGKNT